MGDILIGWPLTKARILATLCLSFDMPLPGFDMITQKIKKGIFSISVIILLGCSINAFSQRSYYEYNNPDALRISRKTIELLSSAEWAVQDVSWLIKKDTFNYSALGATLTFRKDGSFSGYCGGTWKIKYNHYLVLDEQCGRKDNRDLSGVYSITSLEDSLVTLTKVHTSSGDMSKTMTLVKYVSKQRVARSDLGGRSPEEIERLLREWRRRDQENFDALIDSLKFLSKEELAFLGYRESNDTLFFYTADSLYRIGLDRSNPLKRVKIFYEDQEVPDLEAHRRFTLSTDQIPLVDSLAMDYIRKHRDDYFPQKEILLSSYFRQYVGYYDINGDAIVFLNAFCQYKNSWQDSLVQVGLGGVCYFNISVNLSKREAFSFNVNAF